MKATANCTIFPRRGPWRLAEYWLNPSRLRSFADLGTEPAKASPCRSGTNQRLEPTIRDSPHILTLNATSQFYERPGCIQYEFFPAENH